MDQETKIDVTFGDCDPAGIVFYPNLFRWLDRCFHEWLGRFGGHAAICEELGAIGLGLIDARAQFLAPMRPGDRLDLEMRVERWGGRSLSLAYQARLEGRVVVEASEVRGLFRWRDGVLTAGEMREFKAIVGA